LISAPTQRSAFVQPCVAANSGRPSGFIKNRTIVPPLSSRLPEIGSFGDETIVKLANGQIWQQASYHYHYAYSPKVLIYPSDAGPMKNVDGADEVVRVRRIH